MLSLFCMNPFLCSNFMTISWFIAIPRNSGDIRSSYIRYNSESIFSQLLSRLWRLSACPRHNFIANFQLVLYVSLEVLIVVWQIIYYFPLKVIPYFDWLIVSFIEVLMLLLILILLIICSFRNVSSKSIIYIHTINDFNFILIFPHKVNQCFAITG